ncbi:MAG: enoyl-CoA hydratase/isomerase family protein [Deltaproteobacteria bacterium]|nr:enoyl-CoA hydratase/isomerase family protein [Deltaproteobacteria bacterium]
MELETVLYKTNEGVAEISFNRPHVLNAQNRQLVKDFITALKASENDPEVKVVIVKGEGRAFCSGDDLSEEYEDVTTTAQALAEISRLQEITRIILKMPKPVIAAVHGYALGAGCEWCLNCDIRIAAQGTKFGFPETGVGFTVTNAGTKLLPLLVGLGKAKELVFTGNKIDAVEAEKLGLVNKVVLQEDLLKEAYALAERIKEKSQLSIALSKHALHSGLTAGFDETLEREARDALLAFQSPETSQRAKKALKKTKK